MWAALQKTQASSAQAGAALGPGPRPATAAAAVNSGALPMDASLPIYVAAGVLPLVYQAETMHALISIAVPVDQPLATLKSLLFPMSILYLIMIRVPFVIEQSELYWLHRHKFNMVPNRPKPSRAYHLSTPPANLAASL